MRLQQFGLIEIFALYRVFCFGIEFDSAHFGISRPPLSQQH